MATLRIGDRVLLIGAPTWETYEVVGEWREYLIVQREDERPELIERDRFMNADL